jgi:endonuclease III
MAKRAVDVARLKRLYGRLRRAGGSPAAPQPTHPTDELIVALLLVGTTEKRAATAMRRLRRSFVDYNEVRVTRTTEIAEAIGALPGAEPKSQLIPQVLGAVFDRFHRASLAPLNDLSRRDARKFLEDAAGPAAAARVMLMSLGAHAVPADDAVRRALAEEGVIDPDVDTVRLQTALERHLKTGEAYAFFRLLRDHADRQEGKPARPAARKSKQKTRLPRPKAAAGRKPAARKPAKMNAAGKNVVKKAAKQRPTKKKPARRAGRR